METPANPPDALRIELARLSDVVTELAASVRELRRTTTQEALELKARSHALDARLSAIERAGSQAQTSSPTVAEKVPATPSERSTEAAAAPSKASARTTAAARRRAKDQTGPSRSSKKPASASRQTKGTAKAAARRRAKIARELKKKDTPKRRYTS